MKNISITVFLIFLIASLPAACTIQSPSPITAIAPTTTPFPSSATSAIARIPPAAEPAWLSILYPEQGEITLLSEYNSEQGSFGIRSAVCIEISPTDLLETGDYWDSHDVVRRTVVLVDGKQRSQRGEVWEGLVAFSAVNGGETSGPYAFCMYAPLGIGVHRVDVSFEKSSGRTPAFSWTFEIVDHTNPTATAFPTPAVIDRRGHLPRYLRAVYPRPGQVVSLHRYLVMIPADQSIWQEAHPDGEAICIVFKTNKLKDLGSLPKDDTDWPSHVYLTVDGRLRRNWLAGYTVFWEGEEPLLAECMPSTLSPGSHTVTLYIDPYDQDLVTYSWGFTLTE